jgi:hypothetical protein
MSPGSRASRNDAEHSSDARKYEWGFTGVRASENAKNRLGAATASRSLIDGFMGNLRRGADLVPK